LLIPFWSEVHGVFGPKSEQRIHTFYLPKT
jgi:hypothetical protein